MGIRQLIVVALAALSACRAEAPPVKTPEPEVVEAPAPQPVAEMVPAPLSEAPPMEDGVYIYGGCEGEGGCPFGNWRTREPTEMLSAQNTGADVIATLTPGEWVKVEVVETRLVPMRGVLTEPFENLPAGTSIYELEYQGEGYVNYWLGGQSRLLDYTVAIDWEERVIAPEMQATLGLWAKLKRENGQVGWAFEPSFECMGDLGGDTDCRE